MHDNPIRKDSCLECYAISFRLKNRSAGERRDSIKAASPSSISVHTEGSGTEVLCEPVLEALATVIVVDKSIMQF